MSTAVLTIPAPGKWIATNQHGHWRGNHALVTLWRDAATIRARQLGVTIRSPFALHAVVHKRDRRLFDLDGRVGAFSEKSSTTRSRSSGMVRGRPTARRMS